MKSLREIVGIRENDEDEDEDASHYKERIAHHENEAKGFKQGSAGEYHHQSAAEAWARALKHHNKGEFGKASNHAQVAKSYED